MPEFNHLHVHTQFSLLDGAASINGLMKKAQADGMKAVALTDHGNMFGAFKFVSEADKYNLKPIVGCEFYLVGDRHEKTFGRGKKDARFHQLLLAKNAEGYQNLSKLCSLGFIEGYYSKYPRIDKELVLKFHKGIIATSCCIGAEIPQTILYKSEAEAEELLKWWLEIFGEDYYIELQRHGLENIDNTGKSQEDVNQILLKWAKKYKLKVIATNDSHYINEEDWNAHDILLCINTGEKKKTPVGDGKGYRFGFPNNKFYFKTQAEMNVLFEDIPAALDNTNDIVDKVEKLKLKRDILLPNFKVPEGFGSQDDYLKHLSFEGAKRHYESITTEIEERLHLELEVIRNMGFPGYFLIVQDFINVARKLGVAVGPGRGCLAAGAKVVLKNGITRNIEDIRIEDEVITIDGSIQKVKKNFKYEINEELINIKTYYGEFSGVTLTKDHKVFAEKQLRPSNYENWAESTKKARKMLEPSGILTWMPSEKIEIGDWLFIPKPKVEIKNILLFDLAEFSNNKDLHHDEEFVYHDVLNPLCNTIQKTKKVNRFIYLDEDWYKIFGLFVGDGWIRKDGRPDVSIVFNIKDTDKIRFFKDKILASGFEISEHYYKQTVQIHIRNKHLYLLFKKLFNQYEFKAQSKYIPDFILESNEDNVANFLRGYNWADGHESTHKYRFTTVSRRLADQVRFLCWRLGIPASLGIDNRIEIREEFKNAGIAYYVTIPKDERIGSKQAEKNYFYYPLKNGFLVKVRKINKINSEKFVYDFEVENHHNYLTSSFLVHNSAAGSVVAYCTGITNIDPIKYDLLFERFLNPERVSMPDIDIDFDDEGRQKVIDYVVDKYGKNQVAQLITYGTMAAKMAIKDVARVLELPLDESNRLAKLVPEKPGTKLTDAIKDIPELAEIIRAKDERSTVINEALILEGSVRGTGIHAAGVIIAPDDLTNYIPVCLSKDSDLWVTQYDGKVIESAGMLKMDFLGLKTLTIIKDALALIQKNHNLAIDIDKIPLDDAKTFELYQKGDTIGTFQFESEGMRMYLKQLKPTNIEDLIAMNALYRPGPIAFIPTYIDRKHGKEQVEYPHPLLEPILKNTFGIMVYQEQIMLTARVLGGYSLGGADLLRRAMGKKDMAQMKKERETFVKGAKDLHKIPQGKAEEIFSVMEKFAEYGFNRSHSAAYSVVAYQTAYLKANYTAEYMAAVLTHNMGAIEKITFFIDEAKKQSVDVLGPDINESEPVFTVNKNGQVRFGLTAIKGTGGAAVESLMEERSKNGLFKDIFDFTQRINLRTVNKKSFESLAMAGAFDCFQLDRATYFYAINGDNATFIEKILKYGNAVQLEKNNSQNSLFGGSTTGDIAKPKIPECEPWKKLEQLNKEKEVVGFYISGHPLEPYKSAMGKFKICPIEMMDKFEGQEINVAGIVGNKVIRQGQRGAFTIFTLEDYTASVEISLFGKEHEIFADLVEINKLVIVKGKVQKSYRGDRLEIRVNQIQDLEELQDKHCRGLSVKIDVQKLNTTFINQLEETLVKFKGDYALQMIVVDKQEKMQVELSSAKYKIQLNDSLIRKLEEMDLECKRVY